jgi:hypothetical protein
MGVLDEFRNKGLKVNWNVWSVLLGTHKLKNTKTPYQLKKYEPYLYDFLGNWETYKDPRLIAVNKNGDIGLKGKCMFCSRNWDCPDRIFWLPNQTQMLAMTTFTAKQIRKLEIILESQKRKNANVDDLLQQVDYMKEQLDFKHRANDNFHLVEKYIKEFIEK